MPLLGKESLVKNAHPDRTTTADNETFFYFELTDEYFKSHHEYFQRCISCFSEIWTCEYTGKENLTYENALNCERDFEAKYCHFPDCFHYPVLIIAHFIPPQKQLRTLASKVSHLLSLFLFKGESVEFRKFAQDENTKGVAFKVSESFPISSAVDAAGLKGKELIDYYNSISYHLKSKNGLERNAIIKSLKALDRSSPLYSIESIIVFLKQHLELKSTEKPTYRLKKSAIKKFNLHENTTLSLYFPFTSFSVFGELLSLSTLSSNGINLATPASPKKATVSSIKINSSVHKAKLTTKEPLKNVPITKFAKANEPKQLSEAEKIIEAKKKQLIEAEKARKEAERKVREEKRMKEKRVHDNYMSRYCVVREDLLCEDLKPLTLSDNILFDSTNIIDNSDKPTSVMNPLPAQKTTMLNTDQFMDMIMLVEFIETFNELFDPVYEREFSNGIDLALLESSLISKEPNSSFGEVLKCFLATALNTLQEDESYFGKEDNLDMANDIEDDKLREVTLQAISNSNLPYKMFGTTLNNLVLDNCTISEVIRLYLLRSGSKFFNNSLSNDRRKRGCLMFYDDPGIEFIANNKHIINSLGSSTVFSLDPGDKLSILVLLMNQLLTRITFRDHINDSFDNYSSTRGQIREVLRKEQINERLAATSLQKIAQLKADEVLNINKSNNSNNKEEAPILNPYAPFKPETRHCTVNPDQLLNHINENPQDWSLEKSKYIKEKLETTKSSLMLLCFNELQIRGSAFLGYDRYYRVYVLSKYLNSILVFPTRESKRVLKKLQKHFITDQTPELHNFFKNSYGIDLKDPVLIEKVPITQIIKKNFQQVLDKNSPILTSTAIIPTFNQYEIFLGQLTNRGTKEKHLKSCAAYKRDILKYILQQKPSRCNHSMPNNNPSMQENNNDDQMSNEETVMQIDEEPVKTNFENYVRLDFEDSRDNFQSEKFLEPELRNGLGLIITDTIVAIIDIRSKLIAGRLFTEGLDNDNYEAEFRKWVPESILREVKINDIENTNKKISSTNGYEKKPIDFDNLLENAKDLLKTISHSVDPNYLVEPLGLSQLNKKSKSINRKNDSKYLLSEVKVTKRAKFFEKWIERLNECVSFAQLALFFSTLENSIAWGRSAINKKCHQCCRKIYQIPLSLPRYLNQKTNEELSEILLCNLCERVYHVGCLRDNSHEQTESDWLCMNCKPLVIKKQSKLPPAKKLKVEEALSSSEGSEASNQESEDCNSESESSSEQISTRSKYRKIRNKRNGIIDDDNAKILNSSKEKHQTRAVKSAVMIVLKKIVTSLKEKPEAQSLIFTNFNQSSKKNDANVLNFSQIFKKLDFYESPSKVIDDLNCLFARAKEFYSHDSLMSQQVVVVESAFLHMIEVNNLSFFLDD